MPHHLVAFLLVVAVLTVTPGPDMALVLRNGVRGGSRLAWWTGLGCCAGITVHATLAVLGLSAILAASATAYTVLRIAGGVYLIYLGAMALRGSFRDHGTPSMPHEAVSRGDAFRQGVLSNILNPKIALLFLTLLPQFIGESEPRLTTSAVLAATFLGVAVLWWRLFSLGVGALGSLLSRRRVRVVFERVTGVVLVALGIRVVASTG
ncbi:LysE family translocator [Labedaea rhizosphaerae]|uniref:Threonine/homoserine/homoserine lactone efflux protein n=1 Tax=Labedaea rhizosphaerae TaxID=598644 RepID=A0A4R6SC91_LABRH|nr:LysE family translocator [Labedaea rhizosphaerae]TDP97689.1 threonine/homoserine/homoserine lactone efflux protein [Labedaea rhizosphaerae]